jgi:acetyl esterase/lipase
VRSDDAQRIALPVAWGCSWTCSPPCRPRRSPVGAVVYVHGGGWVTGTDALPPLMRSIEQEVVGSGAYLRLTQLPPGPGIPVARSDRRREVCDSLPPFRRPSLCASTPQRIGAIGDSAGGQLVSLLGLTSPTAGDFDVGQYLTESSAVQAVVDLYGPTDLTSPDWKGDTFIQTFARQEFGQVTGPGSTTELIGASPVARAASGAPPFLIVQGARGRTVVPPGTVRGALRPPESTRRLGPAHHGRERRTRTCSRRIWSGRTGPHRPQHDDLRVPFENGRMTHPGRV